MIIFIIGVSVSGRSSFWLDAGGNMRNHPRECEIGFWVHISKYATLLHDQTWYQWHARHCKDDLHRVVWKHEQYIWFLISSTNLNFKNRLNHSYVILYNHFSHCRSGQLLLRKISPSTDTCLYKTHGLPLENACSKTILFQTFWSTQRIDQCNLHQK